ncbi:MAG: hypothetical protein ACOYXR_00840 [Nitrospirota bacterium]
MGAIAPTRAFIKREYRAMEIRLFGWRPAGVTPRPAADIREKSTAPTEKSRRPAPEPTEPRAAVPVDPGPAVEIRPARSAFFAVDGDGRVVIRIVDREGNPIAQIPAAEQLQAMRAIVEQTQGLLDRRA